MTELDEFELYMADQILQQHFPLWKQEFMDIHLVLEMGAKKYEPDGWLEPDGKRASYKEYHDSAFHHLAKSLAGIRNDEESGIDHLLHCAINCLMCYTRIKRGIKHPNDVDMLPYFRQAVKEYLEEN